MLFLLCYGEVSDVRWPLERWTNRIGVSSSTRRSAYLGGGFSRANETTLGELRRFVKALERWPDSAEVAHTSGSVLHVEYFDSADPLTSATGVAAAIEAEKGQSND